MCYGQQSNVLSSVLDSKDTSPSSCQNPLDHQGCRCQQGEAPVGQLHQSPAAKEPQQVMRSMERRGANQEFFYWVFI